MKFRNVGVAIILAILGLIALILIILLLITSIIWIPAIICVSPCLGGIYAICKYTRLGGMLSSFYLRIHDYMFFKSENARRFLWTEFYDFVCWLYPQVQWKFMNYGYAVLTKDGRLVQDLEVEDADEIYPLQMYYHVSTALESLKNLNGMKLLEVGSGRGGGLGYVSTHLGPYKCVGIDISQNQIDFCRTTYEENKKLFFFQGDSENLEAVEGLKEETFDIVINIESSHCYGNFKKFIAGAEKLLKPDGLLVLADFRNAEDVKQLEEDLSSSPLKIIKKEDITLNVLHALKLDEKRRLDLINTSVHSWLRPLFKKCSGLNGTRINEAMERKETLYKAYILKKSAEL